MCISEADLSNVYFRDGSVWRVFQGRICLVCISGTDLLVYISGTDLFNVYFKDGSTWCVFQGRIYSDNCTSYHTETEVADQPSYVIQLHRLVRFPLALVPVINSLLSLNLRKAPQGQHGSIPSLPLWKRSLSRWTAGQVHGRKPGQSSRNRN